MGRDAVNLMKIKRLWIEDFWADGASNTKLWYHVGCGIFTTRTKSGCHAASYNQERAKKLTRKPVNGKAGTIERKNCDQSPWAYHSHVEGNNCCRADERAQFLYRRRQQSQEIAQGKSISILHYQVGVSAIGPKVQGQFLPMRLNLRNVISTWLTSHEEEGGTERF
ncbi:hypothetical protein NC652_010069 [Populus alba x Populus x berolinensis]|nr:hypothetical protein NC652_010069 [Populus alba x Populus x berolinensis]